MPEFRKWRFREISGFHVYNPHQKQLIDTINSSQKRIINLYGVAGTGKTSLVIGLYIEPGQLRDKVTQTNEPFNQIIFLNREPSDRLEDLSTLLVVSELDKISKRVEELLDDSSQKTLLIIDHIQKTSHINDSVINKWVQREHVTCLTISHGILSNATVCENHKLELRVEVGIYLYKKWYEKLCKKSSQHLDDDKIKQYVIENIQNNKIKRYNDLLKDLLKNCKDFEA